MKLEYREPKSQQNKKEFTEWRLVCVGKEEYVKERYEWNVINAKNINSKKEFRIR